MIYHRCGGESASEEKWGISCIQRDSIIFLESMRNLKMLLLFNFNPTSVRRIIII